MCFRPVPGLGSTAHAEALVRRAAWTPGAIRSQNPTTHQELLVRKLIVSTIISVDGYHEGRGKDVLALPFDRGFSAYR
jgi:hypothetical protein